MPVRVCPVCERVFTKADHLARHIRTHDSTRPHSCSVCGKSFARKDTLTRHARTHANSETATSEEKSSPDEGPSSSTSGSPYIPPAPAPAPVSDDPLASLPQELGFSLAQAPPTPPPWDPSSIALFGTDFLSSFNTVSHAASTFAPDVWTNAGWAAPSDPAAGPAPIVSSLEHIEGLLQDHAREVDVVESLWPSLVDTADDERKAWRHTLSSDVPPLAPCSAEFVAACTRAFFQRQMTMRAILHAPTYNDGADHSPLLRLAICAAGAQAIGATQWAVDVFTRMGMLLAQLANDEPHHSLDIILIALIIARFYMDTGDPRSYSRAYALLGVISSASRWVGLFSARGPTAFLVTRETLPLADPLALDGVWRRWAAAQSATRLATGVLHFETVTSGLFAYDFVPPAMPISSLQIELPTTPDSLFEAPTAAAWANGWLAHAGSYTVPLQTAIIELYKPSGTFAPPSLAPWAVMALLDVLRSHARARVLAQLPNVAGPITRDLETTAALLRCRRAYLDTPTCRLALPGTLCNALMTRWNGTNTISLIDTELIQIAIGRDGAQAAIAAWRKLGTSWAELPSTRRAVAHMGQMLRVFPFQHPNSSPWPDSDESPPFKALLTLFAFGLATSRQEDAGQAAIDLTGELDWNEVEDAGLDDLSTTLNVCKPTSSQHPIVRFIVHGGPCSIFGSPPIGTEAGRKHLLNTATERFDHAGLVRTNVVCARAYSQIFKTWSRIVDA